MRITERDTTIDPESVRKADAIDAALSEVGLGDLLVWTTTPEDGGGVVAIAGKGTSLGVPREWAEENDPEMIERHDRVRAAVIKVSHLFGEPCAQPVCDDCYPFDDTYV